jgi:ferritin-like protein
MNFAKTLSRNEMKNVMAGEYLAEDPGDPVTCEKFHEISGCYPAAGGNSCEGKDGNTYAAATSTGSCTS